MELVAAAAEAAKAQQAQVSKIQDQINSLQEQLAEERARRAAEAAEFRADKADLRAQLEAEHAARNALARRVAELAREVAEDRCARADDHQRLLEHSAKFSVADGPAGPPGLGEPAAPEAPAPVGAWGRPPPVPRSEPVVAANGAAAEGRGRGKVVKTKKGYVDATVVGASSDQLEDLGVEILALCDASPSGTVLCANLPRLYYLKYRKPFDLKAYGAAKMAAVVSRLPGVHYAGTHRAEVSREGTGLGDGDDTIDASALAIREKTQARVRAHRDAQLDELQSLDARDARSFRAVCPEGSLVVGAAATREAQTEAFETATRAAGRLEPMLQRLVEACGLDVGAWADLVVEPWDAQRALFDELRAANDDCVPGAMASLVSAAAARARIRREALSLVDAWAGGDEALPTFGASALPRAVGPPPGF
ncbi:hypothetical protein SO694_000930104 [Aureococcus anophagefferens]|uniref:HTH OST-type domain-containing protein n=1 Tax=Aureococcus anophagefferens TaxID=44056 RepID=A0ABR1FS07_AURAN